MHFYLAVALIGAAFIIAYFVGSNNPWSKTKLKKQIDAEITKAVALGKSDLASALNTIKSKL